MRVGLQTISWGTSSKTLRAMLEDIKLAGYSGVEIAQVREDFPDHSAFFDALTENGLALIGVAGGSLDDKISFVADCAQLSLQDEMPYIYADDWNSSLDKRLNEVVTSEYCLDQPVAIAIHPHMFKPIQTVTDARTLMHRYQYLKLLPDVAHLAVAGDDVLAVLEENIASIVAVHLKDWSPEFGRAFPFYSRGFVELGTGRVPIRETVAFLKKVAFEGWVVVEQDYASNPQLSAQRSRAFLQDLGL